MVGIRWFSASKHLNEIDQISLIGGQKIKFIHISLFYKGGRN